MSESIIASFYEKSKDVLKKEYETMAQQTKEMLGECKRKALSKI
jgi:hypothetical protein